MSPLVRYPDHSGTGPIVSGKFYTLQNCTEFLPGPLAKCLLKTVVRKLSATLSFNIRLEMGKN